MEFSIDLLVIGYIFVGIAYFAFRAVGADTKDAVSRLEK